MWLNILPCPTSQLQDIDQDSETSSNQAATNCLYVSKLQTRLWTRWRGRRRSSWHLRGCLTSIIPVSVIQLILQLLQHSHKVWKRITNEWAKDLSTIATSSSNRVHSLRYQSKARLGLAKQSIREYIIGLHDFSSRTNFRTHLAN